MKEVDLVLGSPSPNSPYSLCGRKAAFEEEEEEDGLCGR